MKKKITVIIFIFVLIIGSVFIPNNKVQAQSQDIIEVQTRLRDWGYYNGELTGVLDDATVDAIYYFQRQNGLRETGELDGATASAIGVYISGQVSNDLYLLAKCIYAEARGEV